MVMLSHVFVGVNDFDRAMAFYTPLFNALGLVQKFIEPERPWVGWMHPDAARPLLLIGVPHDGHPANAGNGAMVALMAPTRELVDRCHTIALKHGGRCDGPPGLRPQYHAHYYGAYFRDPEGNKWCVCCHDAPSKTA